MNFNYINKLLIYSFFIFIISCQDKISSINNNNENLNANNNYSKEQNEKIDLTFNSFISHKTKDSYVNEIVNYDFTIKNLQKVKINNFENNYEYTPPINVIHIDEKIYSISSNGEILCFNHETGKLIDRKKINFDNNFGVPVSFSFFDDDFIIGYKSGEIIRADKNGQLKWSFQSGSLLNTPIKNYDNNLIILYPESIVILSPINGKTIFEKEYKSRNVIQSNGGKVLNYFNLIYFLLPNSEFHAIDTFLYQEHLSNLDKIDVNTSLNNLNDNIHIYKSFFSYLDNGDSLYTYDLKYNKFLLVNFRLNNITSSLLFNNSLITKNEKNLEFYNIKNGNIFANINIEKIFKKDLKIIKATVINNKLHIFNDQGKLLILNSNLNIENKIDLKIKKINKIYNYKNKIFISTNKGTTYIF